MMTQRAAEYIESEALECIVGAVSTDAAPEKGFNMIDTIFALREQAQTDPDARVVLEDACLEAGIRVVRGRARARSGSRSWLWSGSRSGK
jgi:hypothetical protein